MSAHCSSVRPRLGGGRAMALAGGLSAPLRPILALRNMVALGFQQIDLVQVGVYAHFHDGNTKMPEHSGGAAVLLARLPVARLVHERLPFHGADAQAADDDVDVDVSRTVVTVRVGADDGGMTGKVVLAELQPESLRILHGQPVFRCVLRVEADDILRMASGACCARIY